MKTAPTSPSSPAPAAQSRTPQPRAFTLIELLVVIAVIAVLAGLLLPALGKSKSKARTVECLNNVRQVAVSFRMFANDNEGKFPWSVDPSQGGSKDSPEWVDHFRSISNDLASPNILACPSDRDRKPVTSWAVIGGFENISYFAGITAIESKPHTILVGDGNIIGGGGGLNPYWNNFLGSSIDATWDETVHVNRGNIAMSDGSAKTLNTLELREQISAALSGGVTNVTISKPQGAL